MTSQKSFNSCTISHGSDTSRFKSVKVGYATWREGCQLNGVATAWSFLLCLHARKDTTAIMPVQENPLWTMFLDAFDDIVLFCAHLDPSDLPEDLQQDWEEKLLLINLLVDQMPSI